MADDHDRSLASILDRLSQEDPSGPIRDFFQKWWKRGLFVLLLLIAGLTSYYQVEPDEVGIVTRLGQYVRRAEPGPHFRLPFGIERVAKVPVQRQLKLEFGFRTVAAAQRTDYARGNDTLAEAQMLTGDLNVADVEWIIQYKIRDAYKYLFKMRNITDTLRDMVESSMRQVVGDRSVTEVLTIGREEVQVAAKEELQRLCDHYENGVEVLQMVLQDVNPPEAVRASFNEVNEAIQERERSINQAEAEYNRVIPNARGKARKAIQEAEGYTAARINRAEGDAKHFLAVLEEYRKAPGVTRTRLHLETMGKVVPKAKQRVIVDDDIKGLLPLLSLQGNPTASLGAR